MGDVDWQLFDISKIPLRRCSLCLYQAKFKASATDYYYCARLKQWTSSVFECPFWDAREDWKEWYVYCTKLRQKEADV
jgi:hypothetical protein